jgi:hypothetical protein
MAVSNLSRDDHHVVIRGNGRKGTSSKRGGRPILALNSLMMAVRVFSICTELLGADHVVRRQVIEYESGMVDMERAKREGG